MKDISMSEPESTEAKLITPQSSGAAVPKLTKPIMPVPNLPKTTPATQQNTFDYKKVHVHLAVDRKSVV
jgi:hypothetical protein